MRVALACLVVLCPTVASAEPREVGVDATLGIPLSPWTHDTGIGGGGSIWLHVHTTPLVEVTARTGAIVHASRPLAAVPGASSRLSEIPLVGGARFREETRDCVRVSQYFRQHQFDGYRFVELQMLRGDDHAHPPNAQHALDAVLVREHRARQDPQGIGGSAQ